jgi:hypothetical protein
LATDEVHATIGAHFMTNLTHLTVFHGVFQVEQQPNGQTELARHANAPASIPGPEGRLLKIATVDARAQAICPSCQTAAKGGFVSFVQDLRIAYACPSCRQMVWLNGA